ncbi:MAG TPA: hypothetical protein VFL31_04340 [Nitrospiraceae bacterium]|nr:hypothetical protein [Nitrospiraceae bacterium]
MPRPHVRETYAGCAELDLAAIRKRLDAPQALWYCARTLDERGEGRLRVPAFNGLGRKTRARLLARGQGIFWTQVGEEIFLRSLAVVAQSLGVERLSGCYDGPIEWLLTRCLRRGRLALNAFATLREGRPVAAATIAACCGVCRRTVLSWCRATAWGRVSNLAILKPASTGEISLARKYADRSGRLRIVQTATGLMLAAQMPNSLVSVTDRVRRLAVLRRANRLLSPCVHRGRGQRQKLYVRPGERRRLTNPVYILLTTPGESQTQLWLPPSIPPLTTGEVFVRPRKP